MNDPWGHWWERVCPKWNNVEYILDAIENDSEFGWNRLRSALSSNNHPEFTSAYCLFRIWHDAYVRQMVVFLNRNRQWKQTILEEAADQCTDNLERRFRFPGYSAPLKQWELRSCPQIKNLVCKDLVHRYKDIHRLSASTDPPHETLDHGPRPISNRLFKITWLFVTADERRQTRRIPGVHWMGATGDVNDRVVYRSVSHLLSWWCRWRPGFFDPRSLEQSAASMRAAWADKTLRQKITEGLRNIKDGSENSLESLEGLWDPIPCHIEWAWKLNMKLLDPSHDMANLSKVIGDQINLRGRRGWFDYAGMTLMLMELTNQAAQWKRLIDVLYNGAQDCCARSHDQTSADGLEQECLQRAQKLFEDGLAFDF